MATVSSCIATPPVPDLPEPVGIHPGARALPGVDDSLRHRFEGKLLHQLRAPRTYEHPSLERLEQPPALVVDIAGRDRRHRAAFAPDEALQVPPVLTQEARGRVL